MAEVVGGALLTVVFEKLFEQLASPELRKNSVASKLKMMEEKLKKVSLFLDDAEDRQLFDKKVKEWLDDLKHIVFMADDLVEEIDNSKNEKTSKRKAFVMALKSLYRCLAKTFQCEIDLILTDLDALFERALVLELRHISASTVQKGRYLPTVVAPLREEHHVYGREAEKEEILKMLLSEEDKMIVLPIVGMGGLGKTTLARLVYDDKRVEQHGFSLKAWVTISTKFDFCKIMKELLQKVNPGISCSNVTDANELQELVQEAVRGKKFLFVLDDVWEEDYSNWDLLKTSFTAEESVSRVIVTTRNRDVGSLGKTGPIYELKEVQKNDSWSIFVHHAFNGDKDADPELQAIGKRIVEKCRGLPLAIRCLGGLLRSERSPQKWESILRRDLGDWSKVMKNGVLPSLWLSYSFLSSSLKQCFAYCSLFPHDYEFEKREIILLWMAEGFVRSDEEGKSMEEVGEQYFANLVSRSLFQRSSEDDDKYVVHDLLHDLATFVYGKFCLRIGNGGVKDVTIRTRHLTYYKDVSFDHLLSGLSTSKHLRTLLDVDAYGRRVYVDDFVKAIVRKVRCLRVLTLSDSMLHNSLGDLKMLRYLNLSGSPIEELPASICSLFHLQTLILSSCCGITRLPKELPRKLSKLRHLDTSMTSLREMPPKMGSLKELRILTDFVVGEGDGSGCSTLKELGELRHLRGKLRITGLKNVDNLDDVEKGIILGDKEEMRELCLEWEGNRRSEVWVVRAGKDPKLRLKATMGEPCPELKGNDTSSVIQAANVLEALQPHINLEILKVKNYTGSSFPRWVGDTSFLKLAFVTLKRGTSRFLPPLGQLPSLREVCIEGFEEVEKIGKEFLYGNDTNSSITPFPSLESLSFLNMKRWKDCSFVESGYFPSLKELNFHNCPKLEFINREDDTVEMESNKLHHHCPSLCELEIDDCPLLERRYQKDKGDHWHYISHIPIIRIFSTTSLQWEEEGTRQGEENSESETVFGQSSLALSSLRVQYIGN